MSRLDLIKLTESLIVYLPNSNQKKGMLYVIRLGKNFLIALKSLIMIKKSKQLLLLERALVFVLVMIFLITMQKTCLSIQVRQTGFGQDM